MTAGSELDIGPRGQHSGINRAMSSNLRTCAARNWGTALPSAVSAALRLSVPSERIGGNDAGAKRLLLSQAGYGRGRAGEV